MVRGHLPRDLILVREHLVLVNGHLVLVNEHRVLVNGHLPRDRQVLIVSACPCRDSERPLLLTHSTAKEGYGLAREHLHLIRGFLVHVLRDQMTNHEVPGLFHHIQEP